MTAPIIIRLYDRELGRLHWDSRLKTSYFQFHPDYVRDGLDVFPLQAPLAEQTALSIHRGENERLYQRLPSFLADSLPDSWGNLLFEQWRQLQGLRSGEVTPLEKLAFIGKRAMGALEFEPAISLGKSNERIDIGSLANLAERIFTEREEVYIRSNEELTMHALMQVGTSAGGRQAKAIIAMHPETGEIRSGQIADQTGMDYYILKFGDTARQTAELEMAYYRMAKEAGIQMEECRLLSVEGVTHFLTRRFDRQEGHKLHMQTLAAMAPEAQSYEDLLRICRRLNLPASAMQEVYRRMIFNYLSNNTDDHNKNFSFLMSPTGEWSLSPAYDMTYIFNTGGYTPERMHCMPACGKLTDWTREDMLLFARENGIRGAEKIINEVKEAILKFSTFAEAYNVRSEWTARINKTLRQHLAEWQLIEAPPVEHSADSWEMAGHSISHCHIEIAYHGNLHLWATIDGQERKFIIRPSYPEYTQLLTMGLDHVPQSFYQNFISTRI